MDFRDELYFLFLTVKMEAGGEPYEGQLAVAYSVMNRVKASKSSVIDAVLRSHQFSCWNTDSPTRMNLDTIPDDVMKNCYKAAAAAYFGLVEDPSKGATHYLNEEETRKMRGGTLPGWACKNNIPSPVIDESKVTARIGRHTFLKL
jgi:spore germination cell wall hydrolase CwlJ-like protein